MFYRVQLRISFFGKFWVVIFPQTNFFVYKEREEEEKPHNKYENTL